MPTIPGVKILDPEVKDNINTSGARISGYKEFRYPLIPNHDGEHEIPSISIAYFDPGKQTYQTLKTDKKTFVATQTAEATHTVQADGMKVLGSDIRHIKNDRATLTHYPGFIGWWIFALYVVGCLFVVFSLVFRQHQARLLTDRAYRRKLRASRKVKKDLRAAARALRNNRTPELLDLLSRVVLGYIGDRFNLDPGAMTKEQLIAMLKENDIDEDTLRDIDHLLHQCDVIRYSPDMTCDDPEKLYHTTRSILGRL
jgi:hypothetical protein